MACRVFRNYAGFGNLSPTLRAHNCQMEKIASEHVPAINHIFPILLLKLRFFFFFFFFEYVKFGSILRKIHILSITA